MCISIWIFEKKKRGCGQWPPAATNEKMCLHLFPCLSGACRSCCAALQAQTDTVKWAREDLRGSRCIFVSWSVARPETKVLHSSGFVWTYRSNMQTQLQAGFGWPCPSYLSTGNCLSMAVFVSRWGAFKVHVYRVVGLFSFRTPPTPPPPSLWDRIELDFQFKPRCVLWLATVLVELAELAQRPTVCCSRSQIAAIVLSRVCQAWKRSRWTFLNSPRTLTSVSWCFHANPMHQLLVSNFKKSGTPDGPGWFKPVPPVHATPFPFLLSKI